MKSLDRISSGVIEFKEWEGFGLTKKKKKIVRFIIIYIAQSYLVLYIYLYSPPNISF
jgi:hypothetical protein